MIDFSHIRTLRLILYAESAIPFIFTGNSVEWTIPVCLLIAALNVTFEPTYFGKAPFAQRLYFILGLGVVNSLAVQLCNHYWWSSMRGYYIHSGYWMLIMEFAGTLLFYSLVFLPVRLVAFVGDIIIERSLLKSGRKESVT
jgi:hypothetical protein